MQKKVLISGILDKLRVNHISFAGNIALHGKHIRAINYHGTPKEFSENFEKQLQFYSRHYSNVTYNDLRQYVSGKKWNKSKPGLIISFDDGHRSNFDYAVPLLEKYGFTGWFFIPSGLIDISPEQQEDFVKANNKAQPPFYSDGRYLMSWDEVRYLHDNHVVGCHTYSHHRMNLADTEEILETEVVVSKRLLEEKLGSAIDIFCWVGGERHSYTRAAAEKIALSGYRFSFMTNTYPYKRHQSPLQIQRTNIESHYPMHLVRFQLSFLMDLFYFKKRKTINRLTEVAGNNIID